MTDYKAKEAARYGGWTLAELLAQERAHVAEIERLGREADEWQAKAEAVYLATLKPLGLGISVASESRYVAELLRQRADREYALNNTRRLLAEATAITGVAA